MFWPFKRKAKKKPYLVEPNFNRLTNAETERLAKLAEECGEVVQIVGKILRHGWESYHPDDKTKTTNRQLLQNELADIFLIGQHMCNRHDINSDQINGKTDKGLDMTYFHHQMDGINK